MITFQKLICIILLYFAVLALSIEKIKLSWEIATLHNNFENLQIEYDALKDLNLKLTTQFYIENSPANIEKTAKEELGMIKKQPKKIIKTNGIIVTIAFNSLEDNIIKNFFKPSIKFFPKDIPLNNEHESFFDCIAKKVRPSDFEIKNNPRSRSAIMRVFKKL